MGMADAMINNTLRNRSSETEEMECKLCFKEVNKLYKGLCNSCKIEQSLFKDKEKKA